MDKTRRRGSLWSLIFIKYRVIRSRIMRWTGHVARLGKCRGAYRVWWKNLRQSDLLESLGINGCIILKWIVKLSDRGMRWIDLNQDREMNAEIKLSGSIKSGKFLD